MYYIDIREISAERYELVARHLDLYVGYKIFERPHPLVGDNSLANVAVIETQSEELIRQAADMLAIRRIYQSEQPFFLQY